MKKKITLIVTCVVLVAAIAVGGTLAWFSDKASEDNVVTMGNVKIQLNDEYVPEDHTKAVPNETIDKTVSVTNVGDNTAYVRVKVTPMWMMKDENDQMVQDTSLNDNLITVNFNTDENWVQSDDGYWYYQVALANNNAADADKTTTELFNTFTLSKDIDNKYADKTAYIKVEVEAVQEQYFNDELVIKDGKIVGWGDVTIQKAN